MTMKYLGVYPESQFQGKNYRKKFSHSTWRGGKKVDHYEVVQIEEVKINVTPSNIDTLDELYRLV